MNDIIRQISGYLRQSNSDAAQVSPSSQHVFEALQVKNAPKKVPDEITAIPEAAWDKGQVESKVANELVDKVEAELNLQRQQQRKPIDPLKKKKTNDDYIHLNSISVTMIPRLGLLRTQSGERHQASALLMPLSVVVEINREGAISPKSQPVFARELLSPNASTALPTLGSVSDYDDFLSKHPFEAVTSWDALHAYVERLLAHVTGYTAIEAMIPDYVNAEQSLILLKPGINKALAPIQHIYNEIITGAHTPNALYQALMDPLPTPIKPLLDDDTLAQLSRSHLAHTHSDFPLSSNQRTALAYALHGDPAHEPLLAINGPPGTGKTTLIQSLVANLWVKRAVEGKEPPIIVATSSNNQAIKNILDSFQSNNQDDSLLAGRWLPRIATYGLYCCAFNAGESSGYPYYEENNTGLFHGLQNNTYIKKATAHYLTAFRAWHGVAAKRPSEALQHIHTALLRVTNRIMTLVTQLTAYQSCQKTILTSAESVAHFKASLDDLSSQLDQAQSRYDKHAKASQDFQSMRQQRGIMRSVFPWLPTSKKATALENQVFIQSHALPLADYSDAAVLEYLTTSFTQITEDYHQIKARHSAQLEQLQQYNVAHQQLLTTLEDEGIQLQDTSLLVEQVLLYLDTTLRLQAFQLATHYWEGRWLLETTGFVARHDDDKKSPVKMLRKWQRFAKLTPCLVATVYMLPKFFTATKRKDEAWQDVPLYNKIDLLIVDEAGQANPEITLASFALAKQAVVIGDTEQIQPVWKVHAGIDRANLMQCGLYQDEATYADTWLESGLLASAGNVMRVAQQHCPYHQLPSLRRGLYLTEHRRCYDPIIAYCNDLVYQGALTPLRGMPRGSSFLPPLCFIHSEGDSTTAGSSRYNSTQVEQILSWLSRHAQTIIKLARQEEPSWCELDDDTVLAKSVAILTPFKQQANRISSRLRAHQLPRRLKVGTVHLLQGGERRLILFSSVYGENHASLPKFYDHGTHLLNVAVSRARDHFVVFGHAHVFGLGAEGTPSALLRERLETIQA